MPRISWRNMRTGDPPFEDWVTRTSPALDWNAKHLVILRKHLERVSSGYCDRLMIFMPPRHGKSETVTVHYAAWRLEQNPTETIIIGSHSQKLANRFSRKVRRIVTEHQLPLDRERKAVDDWQTAAGGGLRAVGAGGGITGFGASLVIIDDPVRGRADAESLTLRDKTYEWFTDDIYTRLTPNGQVILIQTRWHEDDLAGRLLEQMANDSGEKWDVLNLPALCVYRNGDPLNRPVGVALWPKRFSSAKLRRIRKAIGHYSFASLYQQQPTLKEGDHFKREWFKQFVDEPPKGLLWIRTYDLAISTATSADYTASFRVAKTTDNKFYIDGGYVRRMDYPQQRRYILERVRTENSTIHYVEDANHAKGLVHELKRELGPNGYRLKLRGVVSDKLTRALGFAAAAEAGQVYLVKGKWNQHFIDEACSFPKGRHDDQIDAISLAFGVMGQRKEGGGLHTFD